MALVAFIIWLLNNDSTGTGGSNPTSNVNAVGAGTQIPVSLSQTYTPGGTISVHDANLIYDYYTGQGMNQNDASNAMVIYVQSLGLQVPPGLPPTSN